MNYYQYVFLFIYKLNNQFLMMFNSYLEGYVGWRRQAILFTICFDNYVQLCGLEINSGLELVLNLTENKNKFNLVELILHYYILYNVKSFIIVTLLQII